MNAKTSSNPTGAHATIKLGIEAPANRCFVFQYSPGQALLVGTCP